MTEWIHLPNAELIDQVLSDAVTYSKKFRMVESETYSVPQLAAWNAVWNAAMSTISMSIWSAAWDAADTISCHSARRTARSAILALIAYDDAGQYVGMTPDQLKFWGTLSESPAATLLLPYVRARELIAQLHPAKVTA